jgi:hypothetical protein
MITKSFFYLISRTIDLGIKGMTKMLVRRVRAKIWYFKMHRKATTGKAHHTWATIVLNNKLSFEDFFRQTKQNNFVLGILQDVIFQSWMPAEYNIKKNNKIDPESVFSWHYNATNKLKINELNSKNNSKSIFQKYIHSSVISQTNPRSIQQSTLLKKADAAAAHLFDVLGSGPTILGSTIDWHNEFKKDKPNLPFTHADTTFSYSLYKHTFHFDIPVPQRGNDPSMYYEDIKILWDLARMHHLTTLGLAYTINSDQKYVDAFVRDIDSFQNQVSYLLGPHWKCPMDVAIRAINLIWALQLFNGAKLSSDFLQRYTCMLYDHLVYLEWNFEESDKPNNHLLADYVGYLYLAIFFRHLPDGEGRITWIKKTLTQGFAHQISPDGTAYEGSTAYHRLDCELLLHTTSLLRTTKQSDEKLEKLLQKMLTFLVATTDQGGNIATIGDDDSGTIVFGIQGQTQYKAKNKITIFPDFGIGIIRTKQTHLTLRAPVSTTNRPSGHVHHDALSITLSINGQPIFVDPGSFVYTANAWWRHFFKAPHQHNTFFFDSKIEQNADLFQTTLNYTTSRLTKTTTGLHARALSLERTANITKTTITLHDKITTPNNFAAKWSFILHPSIKVEYKNNCYTFSAAGHDLAILTSSLQLNLTQNNFYAAGYGYCFPTQGLKSTVLAGFTGTHTTTITLK